MRGGSAHTLSHFESAATFPPLTPALPMNWSADFQIGALEKPGMIAPIWKSALRCAFKGSKREIFRGNRSPLRGFAQ
jgi:hypothetical protein